MIRLKKHIDQLDKLQGPIVTGKFSSRTVFKCALIASFSKAINLAVAIFRKDHDIESYYKTPNLRGLCEEIIVLKFLHSELYPLHNRMVQLITHRELKKDLEAQRGFFDNNRPFQPTLGPDNISHHGPVKDEIKGILEKNGIKGHKLPPVEQMARKIGLEPLYNYMYRATSNFVHFNPGNLLRTGWGDLETMEFEFKPENFNIYYDQFNKCYVTYLIVILSKQFKRQLGIKGQMWKVIKEMESDLDKYLTWPEIVTFEEMNVKRPSEFFTTLRKAMHNTSGL